MEQTQDKEVDPIPVKDLTKRKIEITKKLEKRQCITEYDPRPSAQVDNQSLLENLSFLVAIQQCLCILATSCCSRAHYFA